MPGLETNDADESFEAGSHMEDGGFSETFETNDVSTMGDPQRAQMMMDPAAPDNQRSLEPS